MKNSFKLLTALFIAFSGMMYACTNSHSIARVMMAVDSIALLPEDQRQLVTTKFFGSDTTQTYVSNELDKFIDMKRLTLQVKHINEKQNGVCDTCVTGYQSAIIENRLVAEQLSKETFELRDKLSKIEKLKADADKTISITNNQTAEMNNIASIRRGLINQSNKELEENKRFNSMTARN